METLKNGIGRWIGVVVKCLLSCVIVWLLISLLDMMRLWNSIHPAATAGNEAARLSAALKQEQAGAAITPADVFWPQFFGSDGAAIHRMSLNGVQITSQEWTTTVPAADVIAYYRDQMAARGWRDVTEETYQFQPESRSPGMGRNGLQDERFLDTYNATMDSVLILRRGGWSMQLMTVHNQRQIAQTTVRIYAAATPSIKQFVDNLTLDFVRGVNRGSPGKALDVEEQSGRQHLHTTIVAKRQSPGEAFQEAVSQLKSQGWHLVLPLPGQPSAPGFFVWLARGGQYGALSVKALPAGQSSSVMFAEVMPENAPRR
ncbi:MAG: hypothetical protein P4N60_06600 [Verrucomicrobiae bacterium]|nr:hypothetical protein [Verrucomicrobiae bacterium]